MGEQRKLLRFRLPWLSAAATTRPVAAPHPAAQTEAPSQPNMTIPVQQPPSRPAGTAPLQTIPTQAQAPSDRNTTDTSANISIPWGQFKLWLALKPDHHLCQPAKHLRGPLLLHIELLAQTLSPPNIPPTAIQERSQPPSSSQSPPSASQKTKPFGVEVKPSQALTEIKEFAPITDATTETSSASIKPKERTERKKVTEERRKTTKASTHEEPEQRKATKLLAAATDAGTKSREQLEANPEIEKRHQQKQEGMGTKKKLATSDTDDKQIKTMSSAYPKYESTSNKAHQKCVSSNWEQVPLHEEIREDVSKFVHKLTTGRPQLPTEQQSISVLTLAGENKGASFHLGSESSKRDGLVHIHRGYKINPDDSPDTTTDGERSSTGRKPKDSATKENLASRAYVNNNIQSINNSIVSESSVNAQNPGVHLELLHNLAELIKSSTKAENAEPHKGEINITPTEKLTYVPTVRRRCLRGLFAESSDSDPDNPGKPRRHGCRYSCGEKNKQKEKEVL
ncbi:hypothetical protein V6N12_051122 [Hibiscus sabdariffa]|uniref:Uncharacterized protein n=1 Tax=Hibiscus sabdariffa TaxID=183260 RepID=A0ABR2GEH8_9ROSI